MGATDADKWNTIYCSKSGDPIRPARVLCDYAHLLPKTGEALDLACGRGGNALFLAERALDVQAWDVSETALEQLKQTGHQGKLIQTRVFDAEHDSMPIGAFDVVVVSRFLQRSLFPSLISALKSGGLIFYQTFIADKAESIGPQRAEYLLGPNELLHHFQCLHILAYREEGTVGDTAQGFRNEAMIVAQKPFAST